MREAREVMAELAATGLTPEQMALIMELSASVAASARAPVDLVAERRRAKDRERKRGGIPRNSAESAEQRVSPTPPSEKTPIPPLKGGTSPKLDTSQPGKPAEAAKSLSAWVGEIWAAAPKPGRERSGRRDLERSLQAAMRRGADPATVLAGVEGYYASPDATKNQGEFAKGVHVVISSGRWEAFVPEDEPPTPPEDADPWPKRLRAYRLNGYWHSDWGAKPGKLGCLAPDEALMSAGYLPPPKLENAA